MRSFKGLLSSLYPNKNINLNLCDNFGLLLNKLVDCEVIQKRGNIKRDFLNKLTQFEFKNISLNSTFKMIACKLEEEGFKKLYEKRLSTSSPLICGLGSTSVLETSITLHHIWGVPYIPASSLKGLCRQVVFLKLVEDRAISDESGLKELQEKFYGNLNFEDIEMLKYQLLFGAQDFKGLLLFLDAYPDFSENKKPFELDIMNPHYQSYYSDDKGIKPPADWDDPVPIYFLTLKEGVSFNFTILFDDYRWQKIKDKEFKEDKKEIFESVKKGVDELTKESNQKFFEEILKKVFTFYGFGSKRRLGYGIFQI